MVGRGAVMMLVMAVEISWFPIALTAAAATLPSCQEVTMFCILKYLSLTSVYWYCRNCLNWIKSKVMCNRRWLTWMVTSIQLNHPDPKKTRWFLWQHLCVGKDRSNDHRCVAQILQSLSTPVGGIKVLKSGLENYFLWFLLPNLHFLNIFKRSNYFWQVLLCFDICWQHLQQTQLHLKLNLNNNIISIFINDSKEHHRLQERSMPGSGEDNSVKYEHLRRPLPRFLPVCMWSCWKASI